MPSKRQKMDSTDLLQANSKKITLCQLISARSAHLNKLEIVHATIIIMWYGSKQL